ncbi:CvpA family protein [Flavobacterium sp.]|mgnify:FL=1|uniref:CvpA family protein n=1 Tax=Flavobacterium sp. TaxID=239 RepID=UPI002FDEC869
MSFIDIVFAVLWGFAVYKGLKNGLFVEVASFVALILGIYLAIKFSNLVGAIFTGFVPSWNPKYIEITAFIITFIMVLIGIHLSAKILNKLADFAFLGWINKFAGVIFSLLKTILALSVVLFIFEKININNMLLSKETQENSIFYNPIQNISKAIYPTIEGWYEELKKEVEGEE